MDSTQREVFEFLKVNLSEESQSQIPEHIMKEILDVFARWVNEDRTLPDWFRELKERDEKGDS